MTTPIPRGRAWCQLAVLVADGLPAPTGVRFQNTRGDMPIMAMAVGTLDDFSAWAEHFGCRVDDRQKSDDGSYWIHTGYGKWCGWSVSLTATPPVDLAPSRELAGVDLTRVRAVAAGDPAPGSQVPAELPRLDGRS